MDIIDVAVARVYTHAHTCNLTFCLLLNIKQYKIKGGNNK